MNFEEYMTITGMDEQTENSCAWEFYKELYQVGQQSKQEEVNKLQLQIDALQKRIDDALDYADGVHSENWQETINTMLHILKGE